MTFRARDFRLDPPYDALLGQVLSFANLAETEETILRLENLRQRFLTASDKKGVECCRLLALTGRRRAEMIAGNRRVGEWKRRQKLEAAIWFRIWLETPELFVDWLALRKETEECRELINAK